MPVRSASPRLPQSGTCSLYDLEPGAVGQLCDARVDAACRAWLRALGVTDACRIRLCKRGEPVIIQVRSTRIGLSREVAQQLFVTPEPLGSGA